MQTVETTMALRTRIKSWREHHQVIAFVPTMGNLHDGHLSLVRKAKELADRVVVSIFVNPLQFNDKNDLDAYPRTLNEDIQLLTDIGCDLVFTPSVDIIYPHGMEQHTTVHVPDMDDKLCGLGRPGHFDGVATVVTKLFNMVQADIAVFGEKDFQQLLLIKKLVHDLSISIDIVGAATQREPSGLAMSSRNRRLSVPQRQQAALIYQLLNELKVAIEADSMDYQTLQNNALKQLSDAGFEPEYVEICRNKDLLPATRNTDKSLRILVAARMGQIRLIDNIACSLA